MTEARTKNQPVRTCAGCGRHDSPVAMVRLVLGPGGAVAVDMAGGAFGRGAHVHPDPECLKQAAKGGLSRGFKTKITATASELADQIVAGCDRRAQGLLLAAHRCGPRALAVGADATLDALAAGARAVVVAADAGSVAQKSQITDAVATGRAVAWPSKSSLGALFGRDEVAVCAVRDTGIADRIVHVMQVRSRCFECRSEVR